MQGHLLAGAPAWKDAIRPAVSRRVAQALASGVSTPGFRKSIKAIPQCLLACIISGQDTTRTSCRTIGCRLMRPRELVPAPDKQPGEPVSLLVALKKQSC